MAIFIVENNGKISYGIKRYICKTMADIPVEVNGEEIAPGSKVYVSDEKKTYMLNTAGQWVEIKEGGGASALSDLTDVDISGSVQGGKVLKYNAVEEKWGPGDDSGNVQSDWNENDPTSGAFILNKPSIPNAPIELTQAEYDALTPAEKMSDTPYLITDANGDGSQFQPVIYSTTEREIGVWTDGKPLYEITLETDTQVPLNNTSWTTIPWNNEPSDIDFLVSAEIARICPNTNATMRFTLVDGHIKGASLVADDYPAVSNLTERLVIRYTKTTDAPGSGIWTPQGVPAVHYSTDERIVGTWIDGSPVYEKTFVSQMESTSTDCIIPFTGFGESQPVLSINGLFDNYVPFNTQGAKTSYITVSSLHQYSNYGFWGSAGIKVSREWTGLYSASPNVVVTVRYLKNI